GIRAFHVTGVQTCALPILRQDHPDTGIALQAYLRRTEADCRDLADPGARVRLCKGAYAEPESVAYQTRLEVDKSYVRCLNILMRSEERRVGKGGRVEGAPA